MIFPDQHFDASAERDKRKKLWVIIIIRHDAL